MAEDLFSGKRDFCTLKFTKQPFVGSPKDTFVTTIDAAVQVQRVTIGWTKQGANSEIFNISSEICDIASSTMLMFIHEIFNHLHLEMVSNYNTTAAATTKTTTMSLS